jgi:hypothetical protein
MSNIFQSALFTVEMRQVRLVSLLHNGLDSMSLVMAVEEFETRLAGKRTHSKVQLYASFTTKPSDTSGEAKLSTMVYSPSPQPRSFQWLDPRDRKSAFLSLPDPHVLSEILLLSSSNLRK